MKILRRGRGLALQGVSVGNASSASDGYIGGRFVVSCWLDRYVVGVNGSLVVWDLSVGWVGGQNDCPQEWQIVECGDSVKSPHFASVTETL